MADKNTQAPSADTLSEASTLEMLKRERRANNAWHKLSRNKTAVIGLVIVVIMTRSRSARRASSTRP